MKKILLASILFSFTFFTNAQEINQKDKIAQEIDSSITYRLFPTQNIWTFIKLDTRNGQLWQVHFDVSADKRVVLDLSTEHLVKKEEEFNGRFTLYVTQNMYNFILLDQ